MTSEGDRESTGGDAMDEAEVDANLEDTFPASDPPSWTLGTDHRPAEPDEEEERDGD